MGATLGSTVGVEDGFGEGERVGCAVVGVTEGTAEGCGVGATVD